MLINNVMSMELSRNPINYKLTKVHAGNFTLSIMLQKVYLRYLMTIVDDAHKISYLI